MKSSRRFSRSRPRSGTSSSRSSTPSDASGAEVAAVLQELLATAPDSVLQVVADMVAREQEIRAAVPA